MIIERVAVPAFHRFNIAAELLVVLVDERNRGRAVERGVYVEATGDPFVPAGDENHFRVDL